MTVKLQTEHHLEFLSLKGDCRGSSESILVKMPHCWKSHATAHIQNVAVGEDSNQNIWLQLCWMLLVMSASAFKEGFSAYAISTKILYTVPNINFYLKQKNELQYAFPYHSQKSPDNDQCHGNLACDIVPQTKLHVLKLPQLI